MDRGVDRVQPQPEVALPEVALPELSLPDVAMPEALPEVAVPEVPPKIFLHPMVKDGKISHINSSWQIAMVALGCRDNEFCHEFGEMLGGEVTIEALKESNRVDTCLSLEGRSLPGLAVGVTYVYSVALRKVMRDPSMVGTFREYFAKKGYEFTGFGFPDHVLGNLSARAKDGCNGLRMGQAEGKGSKVFFYLDK